MAAESENLDARMEAIRLKNEELEKKHKEIKEDEELAKRENAVVDIKKTDIPKHHPYDNVDLDFDVKDTDKELARNPDYKPKSESSERTSFNCLHYQILFSCFLLAFLYRAQIEDRRLEQIFSMRFLPIP